VDRLGIRSVVPHVGAAPHGMRGRQHARFPANIPVSCWRASVRTSQIVHGRMADVSGGGVALDLPTRFRPGTRIRIEARSAIGPLLAEACIRWTRRLPGGAKRFRHGLCLPDSELFEFPLTVLLGRWLKALADTEQRPRRPRSSSQPTRF
jgi:hypothetical protein